VDIEWIARLATSFPGVTEGISWGNRMWSVAGKPFVWERPLTKADIKRFGDARIPADPIIAVRAEDMHDKAAILAGEPAGAFDMQHFENYPAYLIELSRATEDQVRQLVTDGWLAVAPTTLAHEFLGERPNT
jgi:hypothetical protein